MEGFTKQQSAIAKGIAILFLLFHHVFYSKVGDGNVNVCYKNFILYGRICLSIFTFISAYGITCQYKKIVNDNFKDYANITIRRFIKLESACCFIYPLAVFFKRFVVHQEIQDTYSSVSGEFRPIYMVIDMLGLANHFDTPMVNVTWWYLSFAILLIFSLPAIFILYKKVKIFLFPLALLLSFDPLVCSAILGVAFAYEDGFEYLQGFVRKSKKRQVISIVASILLLYTSYALVANKQSSSYVLAGGGILWVYITVMYVSKIPLLSAFLKIMGKYSTDIFLIHTFIYMYFYPEFIYSFEKDYLIYIALLATSLGVAVIVENLKRIIKYDSLINKFINKLTIKIHY